MDIEQLRTAIDETDAELIRLLCRRMEISGQIAEYKRNNSVPVTDGAREREVLERAERGAGEYGSYARRLFSLLIELSKARQNELNAHSDPD